MKLLACRLFFIVCLAEFLAVKASVSAQEATPKDAPAVSLFDSKTLAGWKITDFGGRGDVAVKEGKIVLEAGSDLTGITIDRAVPKLDYEISLEAMLVEGSDFFCGLTLPFGESGFSIIVGGWGGGLVGLSSIDGQDASENETTQFRRFEKGRWYKVRARITAKKIEAWLDEDQLVDVEVGAKKIAMRLGEIEASQPLGIASFRTQAALREIKIRPLSADAASALQPPRKTE